MRSTIKKVLLAGVPLFALTAAPIGFTQDKGLGAAEACAQSGTCCSEWGSTCIIGSYVRENAYYKAEGSCYSSGGGDTKDPYHQEP
jgi:hypothetical protein